MKITLSFLILIAFSIAIISCEEDNPAGSDNEIVEFEFTHGGDLHDQGYCVEQCYDLGYIFAGTSNSFYYDIFVFKTDIEGFIEWEKSYDGTDCKSVCQAGLSGYAILGETDAPGTSDIQLILTSELGEILTIRAYGGGGDEQAYCIKSTGGGFIIAGSSDSFGLGGKRLVYLIKTDQYGVPEWEHTYDEGTGDSEGMSVVETLLGNYIVTGKQDNKLLMMKVNPDGAVLWSQTFGNNFGSAGYSIVEAIDGGYTACGEQITDSTGYFHELYLVNTDYQGNLQWEYTLGGDDLRGRSIYRTQDGGYVVTGICNPGLFIDSDLYLAKIDDSGSLIWDRLYGEDLIAGGHCVRQTYDGGYIATGYRSRSELYVDNDFYMLKTGPNP